MSTYLYLVCLHHEPNLRADGESGQHTYDLPQIREDIANRDVVALAWKVLDYPDLGSHFRSNTMRFLLEHPKCQVGIKDEYGKWHPLVEGEAVS